MPKRAPKKANLPPIKEVQTAWHEAFLAGLKICPVVSYAARLAKVSRRNVYEQRERFPEFAAAWDDAIAEGIEMLEAEAHSRARRVSDTLMIFLLKAHKPQMYRERLDITHGGETVLKVEYGNDGSSENANN
jgi:hypothetical protein